MSVGLALQVQGKKRKIDKTTAKRENPVDKQMLG